jgi:structural maintenance of chromosome 1
LIEQVSGSDEYKQEYEELKEQMEKANEIVITNVNKKKGITAEKSLYKLQKKEADKFKELSSEHSETQIEYILWRLYYIEKGIKDNKKEIEIFTKESEKITNTQKEIEKELNEKKKSILGLKRKNITLTSENKQLEKKILDFKSSQSEIKVKKQHIEKTVDFQKKKLEKRNQKLELHLQEIKDLQSQLNEVTKEADEYEQLLKKSKKKEIKLLDDQLNEYHKLKGIAGTKTVTLQQQLESLISSKEITSSNEKNLLNTIEQLRTRKDQLEKQHETYSNRIETLQEILESTNIQADEKKSSRDQLETNSNERGKKKENIEKKILDIREKLLEAKVMRNESERDVRFKESLISMKNLYKGVKGKLIDLCKISNEKYNIAVHAALGLNINSIVVDDEKTAIECIEYLKEQRINKATFIPLNSIKFEKINERLRKIGENVKLVIDVISYEEIYERAFLYAIGNTIVCDDLEDAMDICYNKEKNEHLRAVTLDGTIINKSGFITGGMNEMEKSTKRVAQSSLDDDINMIKQKRDELVKELQEIIRDESIDLRNFNNLENDVSILENRIKYTKVDLDFSKKKLESSKNEITQIDDEFETSNTKLKKIRESNLKTEKEIEKIEKLVYEIEKEIFGDFSQKVGVENIREYENSILKSQQEAMKKRLEFKTLISRFENKLDYEKKRDLEGPIKEMKDLFVENEKKLKKIESDDEKIEKEIQTITEKLKNEKKSLLELKKSIEDEELVIAELEKKIQSSLKDTNKNKKNLISKENQIEQYRFQREEIYKNCKLEEIELPLFEENEKSKKKKKTDDMEIESEEELSSSEEETERNEKSIKKDEMDIESEEEEKKKKKPKKKTKAKGKQSSEEYITQSEKFSVSQKDPESKKSSREDFEEIVIDFTSLNQDLLNINDEEYSKIEMKYKQDLKNLQLEIENLTPSLRAVEKFKIVQKKFDESNEEVKDAKFSSKEATKKFEDVKQKRYDTFMKAYEPISSIIDEIYKELTKTSKNPLGGTAYLGLEDHEE